MGWVLLVNCIHPNPNTGGSTLHWLQPVAVVLACDSDFNPTQFACAVYECDQSRPYDPENVEFVGGLGTHDLSRDELVSVLATLHSEK